MSPIHNPTGSYITPLAHTSPHWTMHHPYITQLDHTSPPLANTPPHWLIHHPTGPYITPLDHTSPIHHPTGPYITPLAHTSPIHHPTGPYITPTGQYTTPLAHTSSHWPIHHPTGSYITPLDHTSPHWPVPQSTGPYITQLAHTSPIHHPTGPYITPTGRYTTPLAHTSPPLAHRSHDRPIHHPYITHATHTGPYITHTSPHWHIHHPYITHSPIHHPHFAKSISVPTIKVGDTQIEPSLKVKNLGVIFDKFLKMDDHITTVCKACYFHLKNIRSLKPYLSREALLTVTHSFITARIGYCNGLLYGITEPQSIVCNEYKSWSDHPASINRLQRIQNCAARLITNTKKYGHITPVLYTLHWLPIRQRVQYKILLLYI